MSKEHGFPVFIAVGNIMRGWCLGALGQAAEGVPLVLQGLQSVGSTGAVIMDSFFLTMLADIHRIARQPEKGLDQLAQAANLVERTQARWAEAEVHRLRGSLLLLAHEHAAAENSFHRALAVARSQNALLWELRAATSLARLWRDQGRRTEAHDLLAPVYGLLTEGFDTPVLKQAKALLNELAA